MSFYLRLDPAAVGSVAARHGGRAVQAAAYVTRDRARSNLAAAGRHATGALSRSIEARQAGPFTWTVGSPLEYAVYQEFGVGPIRPRRAKILRFKPKGSAVHIFRPYSSGFPPAYFLRGAYRSLTTADFVP